MSQDQPQPQPQHQGQVPAGYYQQPPCPPQGYAPQPPVIFNVVQQNISQPAIARKRVHHWRHFWLTLLTGGLWLAVWIPVARRHRRTIAYYR